jgi:1-deoxy-D-xylulose-5-phosphate reductoisomerase
MVVARDGAVLAQLGTPDMKGRSLRLAWPGASSRARRASTSRSSPRSLRGADRARFPGLFLSWDALRAAPGSTAVLNAANEIAVESFLDGRLRFDAIHRVNARDAGARAAVADEARSIDGAARARRARARRGPRHVAQAGRAPVMQESSGSSSRSGS